MHSITVCARPLLCQFRRFKFLLRRQWYLWVKNGIWSAKSGHWSFRVRTALRLVRAESWAFGQARDQPFLRFKYSNTGTQSHFCHKGLGQLKKKKFDNIECYSSLFYISLNLSISVKHPYLRFYSKQVLLFPHLAGAQNLTDRESVTVRSSQNDWIQLFKSEDDEPAAVFVL